MQKLPEPGQDTGDNASLSWVRGATGVLVLMVGCCQRCRALLPVSQFSGIRVAAEQRPSHTHTHLLSSPRVPRPAPLCHLTTSLQHRQVNGVKIWCNTGMSSTVTGLHFLLNLLSSFALPSFPFCRVLHLCAWSPAHGTPGPAGRSHCSDTTSLLRGWQERGQQLSPSKAEMSQPGLLAGGCPHPAGSVALLQPPSRKAAPLGEAIHGAKGRAGEPSLLVAAAQAMLRDVFPEDGSGLRSPCVQLVPKVAAAGVRGTPAAVPAPSPR